MRSPTTFAPPGPGAYGTLAAVMIAAEEPSAAAA
jgi:hypothetical protein